MPADGRSAWIDEGLARWFDGGFYGHLSESYRCGAIQGLPIDFLGLGKRSDYLRTTFNIEDRLKRDPYAIGACFFSFLHGKMGNHFFNFLKSFHRKYTHRVYTQAMFFNELNTYLKANDIIIEIKQTSLSDYVNQNF